MQKPIYFMAAAWGARYIDATCRYLLRSLMTENNAFLLRRDAGHRFLLATTRDGWQAFLTAPEVDRLSPHLTFEWVEIDDKPAAVTVYRHMTEAHKRLVELVAARRGYGCILAPDVYLSDNFVRAVLEHAAAGTQVLLASAWHTAERKLFRALAERNLLEFSPQHDPPIIRPGIDPVLLGATCSQAVHACVACMEWDSPSFDVSAVFVWWRLPGAPGLLVHCMYWARVGLDYSALQHHSLRELEHSTIEGLYVQDNFGPDPTLDVLDGNVAFVCSWKEDELIAEGLPRMSASEYIASKRRAHLPLLESFRKGVRMRAALYIASSRRRDRIKRRLFFRPVVWGRSALSDEDQAVARRAQQLLRLFTGDFRPGRAFWKVLLAWPWFALLDVCMQILLLRRRVGTIYLPLARSYWRVITAALRGDARAQAQIARQLRKISAAMLGHSLRSSR